MRSRFGAWLLVPLVALSLASCSGTKGAENEAGKDDLVDGGYIQITEPQGSTDGFVGASEDVETQTCEKSSSGWISEGLVTNPTDRTQSYRIYVAFSAQGDTKGLVQVDVPSVASGAEVAWKAEAPLSGDDLTCALRVERFDPQE